MQLFKRKPPEVLAAVDLGSNSFHLIVARLHNGEPVMVDRLREMVRLGNGLDEMRRITPEAQEQALACLTRFGERLRGMPAGSVRAVGTNTLRSARNSNEFIEAVETALGHPIEIISGVEEARLIYLGVSHSLPADGTRRLVMDIGGGSTELIIGEGFEPLHMESLHMGCVSMTKSFFADGTITPQALRAAELAARMELEPIESRYRQKGWDMAIGASGTIRAVGSVCQATGWCTDGISLSALHQLRTTMLEAAHIDNLGQITGLSAERAPVFPGGVMVLLSTFEALGIEHMRVADGALREGLIYDLLGRLQDEDVRSRTIRSLAQRYHIDLEQATRVEHTAMAFLNQVAGDWGLENETLSQFLGWAAQLYEIGLDISHSQYHKHGAYIVEYSDMPGFSRQEQKLLASLIRTHRRKFPATVFKALPKQHSQHLQRLAILLRLSVLLHRSRSSEPLPDILLAAKKKALTLNFPAGWLDSHPLTQADLTQEANYLQVADFKLEFA